jgi:hypothetical protein
VFLLPLNLIESEALTLQNAKNQKKEYVVNALKS